MPLKIHTKTCRANIDFDKGWLPSLASCFRDCVHECHYPLRFSVVDVTGSTATLEMTVLEYEANGAWADELSTIEMLQPRIKSHQSPRFAIVQVIPTGIRCEFGGFAGDAAPVTNLLASIADLVITHPNAVNASDINEMAANVLYVEGKSLDDFLLGHLGLRQVRANRIGSFVDPTGIDYLDDVIHVLNAARASAGIDCRELVLLEAALGVTISWTNAGCACGTVVHLQPLLDGVQELLARGVQAIGGLSVIHGVTQEMFGAHLQGNLPNPSGAIEAIITHLISKLFRVPVAHAPLPYYQDLKVRSTINPRASAEFISTPHYFSVLKGLQRAPQLVCLNNLEQAAQDLITINDVGAVVAPASALGGIPTLAAQASHIPVIAVSNNRTVLDVTHKKMHLDNVIEVDSYLEAAGVVAALKSGISLESLRRPIAEICISRADYVAKPHRAAA